MIDRVQKEMKYYAQEQPLWCLYACTQMLLEFYGINGFDQKRLYEIHMAGGGGDKSIGIFIRGVNKLIGDRMKYNISLNLAANAIKNHIENDDPVCVNLYLEPDGRCGHSHMIYGYDDDKDIFSIIDPDPNNKTGKGKYYDMSYNDFNKGFECNRQKHVGKEIFIVK